MERDFDKLWNFDNPSETEAKFRDLLPASPDDSYRLELMTQIARTLGLQRKFVEAHAELDLVEKELMPGMDRVCVRYMLERGRAFNSSGKPESAEKLFLNAWEIAQRAGEDELAVDALHMVAIVSTPEEALKWNERAIEYAKGSSDERARNWLGSLYNNVGWTYHDMGNYEKALAVFKEALAYREQRGNRHPILIARYCVGRCLRSLGRFDEALTIQQEVHEDRERAGEPHPYVQEELGELLFAMGKPEEAKPYFAEAYNFLSQDPWLAEKEPERINALKERSGVHSHA